MRILSHRGLPWSAAIRPALAGLVAAALVALAGASRAEAAPMLAASPNPVVIPYGATTTVATLRYDTGSAALAEVWVSVDGAPDVLLIPGTATAGAQFVTVTNGSSYEFKLFAAWRNSAPPLATHTVTTTRPVILLSPGSVLGALRTRTVEVTFTTIRVIDDSDDLSAGDLRFWFLANGEGPQTWSGDVSSGGTISPNKTFTLEDAPGTLSLRVTGADDDEFCPFSLCTCGGGMPEGNGSNECADWSTVTRTIDVSSAATTGTFEMTATGSPLKFRVFGRYTVTYHFL